jgi:hypothetical protein
MQVNADQVVRILPLPDDTFMNSKSQVITGIDDKGIAKYSPNGLYEITASSQGSIDNQPYVIANDNDQDFWQCGFANNPNYVAGATSQYTQDPYTGGSTPSSYQGGGKDNTWTTPVGSDKIINVRGEWIQLRIPYKAFIQQYGIRTPTYTQYNTFPRKFMLVASNDGTAWTQLDQRNLKESELPTGAIIKKSFDINSPEKYSYFRLIVMGMGPFVETVKISELMLFGTTMVSANPNALNGQSSVKSEPFVTLNRSVELNAAEQSNASYDGINMYDRQYGKYNLDPNVATNQIVSLHGNKLETKINSIVSPDYLLKTSIITCILLTGVFFYKIMRK